LRDTALRSAWAEVVSLCVTGSCHPQRVEFRRSARTIDEYEQMSEMFDALDLLICATAAHRDLAVLHDDNDFAAAAQHLPDLRQRSVHVPPEAAPPEATSP
jgi:hypothetical protein